MCSFKRTPWRLLRKMLASVAFRTSIGSRRMSVPSSSNRSEGARLVLPAAQLLKDGQAAVVAAHHLPIDQDRPNPEMVHGLYDQRIPGSPVMAVAGQQPDAHWV